MALNLKGKILNISNNQKISDNLTKRTFVIETSERYPQKVQFEMYNDKTSIIDNYSVGDNVDVAFNVRCREYKSTFYTSLKAWQVKNAQEEVTNSQQNQARIEAESDLPF